MAPRSSLRRFGLLAASAALVAMGSAHAQIEPGNRGIQPIGSSNDLAVSGIQVDEEGESADEARLAGWREAQRKGWEALFKQTNGGATAPKLSDSVLDGIVSAIVVEREQIGPGRYVATLGIQFDRARAGEILGTSGRIFRSPPYLVMPIVIEAGVPQTFASRSEWQRAWAEFKTSDSSVDYVRTAGNGSDLLLLNPGQAERRQRRWWRDILDYYGASDVLIPTVRIERSYPGGPITARFAARYGPDNQLLGTAVLTTNSPAGLPRMMDEGVRRVDAIYLAALADGRLRTDPSLVIPDPVALPPELVKPDPRRLEAERRSATDPTATSGIDTANASSEPEAAPAVETNSFSIQIETPSEGAVSAAESALRGVAGVESASTSSAAIGGTSVVRIRFRGDADALRSALSSAGWRVSSEGSTFRIAR